MHTEEQDGGNRLSQSGSPYLLQHAENPVAWQPWDDRAFELATSEDKPLFISIGYSTCHWCHVMARESFEDPDVAELLNRACVPIKVDREERPDIDAFYMDAALSLHGSGGWPLTVFATPEGKPFILATYIPKHSRGRSAGLMEIIPEVERLWREERQRILDAAESISSALRRESDGQGAEPEQAARRDLSGIGLASPSEEEQGWEALRRRAADAFNRAYDPEYGGFGAAPKFPQPQVLRFLLLRSSHEGAGLPEPVARTLRAMRVGGIYDHIGFGFHRYAVDRSWTVPHFEKMLYDQAMLAALYLDAYQASGEELFAATAREVLTFLRRELASEEGGWYAALDAESEGEEGRFYLWSYEEFLRLLPEDGEDYARFYHLQPEGNWRDPVTGEAQPSNILCARPERPRPQQSAQWERVRQRLLAQRDARPRPARDEKILADWNGMVLGALAKAARVLDDSVRGDPVLDDSALLREARRTAEFLLERMRDDKSRLLHSYRAGEVAVAGGLDDYAFIIAGLLELYRSAFDPVHLEQALELSEQALELFSDSAGGGFLRTAVATPGERKPGEASTGERKRSEPSTGSEQGGGGPADPGAAAEALVAGRPAKVYDGAIPAGYAVMTENLLRLFRITGEPRYRDRALLALQAAKGQIERAPHGAAALLTGSELLPGASGGWEIVLVGEGDEAERMLSVVNGRYLPRTVVVRKTSATAERLAALAPYTKAMQTGRGDAAAYLCRGFQCDAPLYTAESLAAALDAPTPS